MNEFVRIAMELADSYAESRESEATSKAEGDHGGWETALTQRRRSALLSHLEGGEQKWIRVGDQLPTEDSMLVAVHSPGSLICDVWPARWTTEYQNFGAGGGWFEQDEVTHWMPLPATPTEEASK